MTTPTLTSPNINNYMVGKGIAYVKLSTDNDYVDIGNCPEFELTPTVEVLDHFSSRAGVRSKDHSVAQEKSATLRIVMEEFTARNLALMLLGSLNDADPSNVQIDILSEDVITAAIRFVGTNDVGPKWTYDFPEVQFRPSAALAAISEEWANMEVTGEVLYQENEGRFGTAVANFAES